MVFGFWEAQLSAPIKSSLAGQKFNADTYQALFKKADDQDAKKDTLLGFVQIQSLFDGRVRKLFEDEVRCPEELHHIKKTYM